MKRILSLLLCLLLLLGCNGAIGTAYRNAAFTASLPAPFEPVDNVSIVCFAPYGNPLLSSSITFYTTELNWYFDTFSEDEYTEAVQTLCGYESLSVDQVETCRIDGFDARRIACTVQIDQGTHNLILYAVNADRTYFFTLLNRDCDDYVASFDEMMKTVHFTEGK